MEKEVYLMDLAWHLYRSYHSFGFMSAKVNNMEKPTGHIFGVLSSIQAILQKNQNIKVVLCEDGRAPGKSLNTNYKQGREKLQYNIMQDRDLIEKIACLHPSVMVATNPEAEADQIMFTMAKRYESQGYKVTIYSGDNDLLQALSDNISIYRGHSRDGEQWITLEKYNTEDRWRKKLSGCPVEHLATFRALTGDTSDNLRGIDRIPKEMALIAAGILDLSNPEVDAPSVKKCLGVLKTSHKKYMEEITKNWYRLHVNHKIMKLTECKVTKKKVIPSRDQMVALQLNKWSTFLEESRC